MSNEEERRSADSPPRPATPAHSAGTAGVFLPGPMDESGNPIFVPGAAPQNEDHLVLPPPHTPESLRAVNERLDSKGSQRTPFSPQFIPRREPDPTLGRKRVAQSSQQRPTEAATNDQIVNSPAINVRRASDVVPPPNPVFSKEDVAREAEKDERLYVPSSLHLEDSSDEFGGLFGSSKSSAHVTPTRVPQSQQADREYAYEAEELVAPEPVFQEPVAPPVTPEDLEKQGAAERRQAKRVERARKAREKRERKEAALMEKKEKKELAKAFRVSESQRRAAEKEERKRQAERQKAERAEADRLAREAKKSKRQKGSEPIAPPSEPQAVPPVPSQHSPQHKKASADVKKAKQQKALQHERELLEAYKGVSSAELEAVRREYELKREAVRQAQRERDEVLGKKGVTLAMRQRRSLNIKWGAVAVVLAVLSALGGAFLGLHYGERVIDVLPFLGESGERTSDVQRAIETETGAFITIAGATQDDCGAGLYVSALGGEEPFFLNSLRFEVNSVSVQVAEETDECPNGGYVSERTASTYFVYLDTEEVITSAAIIYEGQRFEWSAP